MTKSMSESEKKEKDKQQSVLTRVCPEFHNLLKDVQIKTYAHGSAQASKIVYDQMIFDTNMASIFQKVRKKV